MALFNIFKKSPEPKVVVTTSSVSYTDDVIPIEQRVKGTIPPCDGLYPHEVLVLSYADKCTNTDINFSGFWWYKYGIKDVQSILKKLLAEGFIGIGTVSDALALQKLTDLKPLLQAHNLKVSGKKEDIIKRLMENVSTQELEAKFPQKPYKLTANGETTLKKYEWIPYIHRHSIDGLDIWNLTTMVQTPPYTKYRDKIWGYFNQIGAEYAGQNNWGLYRNIRFQMSEFVMEEDRHQLAFVLLCEVVAYDLSGVGNGFRPEFMANQYKFFYPYEDSIVKMAPGITERIKKLAVSFAWSDNQLYEEMLKQFEKVPVMFSIFTNEEKARIVIAEMNNDNKALASIYTESQKRFKKEYRIK